MYISFDNAPLSITFNTPLIKNRSSVCYMPNGGRSQSSKPTVLCIAIYIHIVFWSILHIINQMPDFLKQLRQTNSNDDHDRSRKRGIRIQFSQNKTNRQNVLATISIRVGMFWFDFKLCADKTLSAQRTPLCRALSTRRSDASL